MTDRFKRCEHLVVLSVRLTGLASAIAASILTTAVASTADLPDVQALTEPPAATARAQALDFATLELDRLSRVDQHIEATFSGGSAVLTLDPRLQERATRLLARARPERGAIVVASVRTGAVLAWAESHRGHIVSADLPAASLFKIITAAALLERTPVTPKTRVCTEGGQHGIERRHLLPASGDGALCDIFYRSLGRSRNAAFAQLAHRYLSAHHLQAVAERFGFNRSVPFDFEAPFGTLVVPEDPLGLARTAAGFDNSLLSPLGALHLMLTLARMGQPSALYLVQSAGGYQRPTRPEGLPRVLNAVTARRIRNMLEQTVHAGTSLEAFTNPDGRSYLGPMRVAGKTGTLKPDPAGWTTSWFAGFAPSQNADIVVAVALEHGPVWHQKANEVARDVLRTHFARSLTPGVTDPLD